MSANIAAVGVRKVRSVANGESKELKNLWEDQNVAIIFFRRWGCMFCRVWAKEVSSIAPVLARNNVKLIGVGVEEVGSKEFVDNKYFDGDLYYVEDVSTYHDLGFKRFNHFTILTSLLWKSSRETFSKGRTMAVGGDLKGDWVQAGGALLVGKGGNVQKFFTQTGPGEHLSNLDILKVGFDLNGDWVQVGGALLVGEGGNPLCLFTQRGPGEHLSNLDILKTFGLENEYNPETMANKPREERGQCNTEASP